VARASVPATSANFGALQWRVAMFLVELPPKPLIGADEPDQQRNQRPEGSRRRNEPGLKRADRKAVHREVSRLKLICWAALSASLSDQGAPPPTY
jgi:hypothetical protein